MANRTCGIVRRVLSIHNTLDDHRTGLGETNRSLQSMFCFLHSTISLCSMICGNTCPVLLCRSSVVYLSPNFQTVGVAGCCTFISGGKRKISILGYLLLLFSSACTDRCRGGTQLSVSSKVGWPGEGTSLEF